MAMLLFGNQDNSLQSNPHLFDFFRYAFVHRKWPILFLPWSIVHLFTITVPMHPALWHWVGPCFLLKAQGLRMGLCPTQPVTVLGRNMLLPWSPGCYIPGLLVCLALLHLSRCWEGPWYLRPSRSPWTTTRGKKFTHEQPTFPRIFFFSKHFTYFI